MCWFSRSRSQVLLRWRHDQQGAREALCLQVCVWPEDSDWLQCCWAQQPGDRVWTEETGSNADARPRSAHHYSDLGNHSTREGQLKEIFYIYIAALSSCHRPSQLSLQCWPEIKSTFFIDKAVFIRHRNASLIPDQYEFTTLLLSLQFDLH